MRGKNAIKPRITPAEAARLFKFSGCDEIVIADELLNQYNANAADVERIEPKNSADKWRFLELLSFVYDTGRVQGIREERARRLETAKKKLLGTYRAADSIERAMLRAVVAYVAGSSTTEQR